MVRYFFDLKFDGEDPTEDEEGYLYPTFAKAQVEAARALADLAKEMTESGRDARSLAVILRDASGPVMEATLHFAMKRQN